MERMNESRNEEKKVFKDIRIENMSTGIEKTY